MRVMSPITIQTARVSNPYAPIWFFFNVKKYFSHRTMHVCLKIKIKIKNPKLIWMKKIKERKRRKNNG